MAFVKRELPLSFNLDDDIYGAFDATIMRNQPVGNPQQNGNGPTDNDLQPFPVPSGADDNRNSDSLKDKVSDERHQFVPFQIKTEYDELAWNQRDNADLNAQINAAIGRTSQNPPQMTNAYNHPLNYQSIQNPSNYQQIFPLAYERHHQAFANSFLSAYSQANSSNMPYFRQQPDLQISNLVSKDLDLLDSSRKRDIDNQFSKNLIPNELNERLQALSNQELLYSSVEKIDKDREESSLMNNDTLARYGKLKTTNGMRLSQATNVYSSVEAVLNEFNEKKQYDDSLPAGVERVKSYQSTSCDKGEPSGLSEDGKGKFNCEDCPYACQSSAILKIHERTHSGEKPFKCKYCDYKSGQKNNVVKHVLVHMKEKPFRCQYCVYTCAQKNNLVVHERTHTGEKPFVCTYCEYRTVQKPNLVKHMYLHTNEKPFSCDVCEYRCVQKTNLMKHKQKHSTEKPFECSECDYKSTQKANLNKHQILHTKPKPFQCELCSFQCAQKCNLSKHKQSKHGQPLFDDKVNPEDKFPDPEITYDQGIEGQTDRLLPMVSSNSTQDLIKNEFQGDYSQSNTSEQPLIDQN